MTCRDCITLLGDFIAQDLTPTRELLVAAHLAACDECSAYLENYVATMRLARQAWESEPEVIDEGFIDKTVNRAISVIRRDPAPI